MDLRKSISNQTDFSLHLTNHVGANHSPSSNLAFSPLSVHIVLSLVAAGSKGPTHRQLASFLRSDAATDDDLNSLASQIVALVFADASALGGPKVSFANGLWAEKSIALKDSFANVVTGMYQAEAKDVDFKSKAEEVIKEVNSWVGKATSGLIDELLPPGSVDRNTRLVLGNALYFKGSWTEKFEASETKDSKFHLLNGETIQVPFMTSVKKQFVSSYDGFKVLRLPYKQGEDKRQYSMYLYLPDTRDGLLSLSEKLSSGGSGFLERHLPSQKTSVGEFMVPRFKISFGLEVSGVLKNMGLVLPFNGEGDLSEMVDSDSPDGRNLYVSNIFHKSFIEVNEEGTEAAAASGAVIALRSMPAPPVDFVADHPFVFLIREDMTGVLMFSGHVVNPLLTG